MSGLQVLDAIRVLNLPLQRAELFELHNLFPRQLSFEAGLQVSLVSHVPWLGWR